jgi:hypothetical protein
MLCPPLPPLPVNQVSDPKKRGLPYWQASFIVFISGWSDTSLNQPIAASGVDDGIFRTQETPPVQVQWPSLMAPERLSLEQSRRSRRHQS